MKKNPTPSTCSASQASLSARLGLAWVLVVAWLAPAAQGSNASASFTPGGQLVLSGTGFRGISSASRSDSSQDSPTGYPMVQFRRLDNEQSAFLLSDPAVSVSDTSFIWAALRSFPIANGIPSGSVAVLLSTVNQPPTISGIPDQIINEDSSTAALTFVVSDAETPAAALDVTGASSDTTLIPNANIVLSGAGANRVVMVTPAADQFGSATITLSVDDGNGGTANTSFVVTVNSVDDLPTITPIADLAITSGTSSPAIPFTIGDVETPAGLLILTATSSNPGLVAVSNITFGGTGANRSVAITPAANQVGSALIGLTVTDTNSGNATAYFTVNATPSSPSVIFGPIINPANSNTFFLLDLSSWSAAETVATSIGGHLVTIRNQSEQDWVYNTFGNIGGIVRNLWIGLYDPDPINNATDPVARMDEFVWSSGEPVGYSNWTPGEPNNFNGTGEFFVQMWNPGTGASSLWNDNLDNPSSNQPGFPWNGVVELTQPPVNDAPSFAKGADQTVLEDAGPQTVTGWATAITAGPPDEFAQVWTFIVTNNNNALFSVQPAIDTSGTLTYTPALNANGIALVTVTLHDNGGTANGGVDTSAPQTLSITVNPVNDPPSFTKGADQTVNEDAGTQTVAGWATGISAGPPDEAGQTLIFSVSNNNNALFSAQPAIAAAGTLTYTPAANASGSALVTVTLHDSGGTANGGVDTTAQTLSITVNPVNDPPSFTKGADQAVSEDAGSQTVAGWATGISAGPPDEAGQTVNFLASNNNNALFSAQPAIDSTGTLTYTPAANANGIALVTVTLRDNGGTANGGVDTNAPQTLSITVNPVNDPPSFTKGADQTVNEDAGTQTVAGWATGISAGPPDEAGQTVNFLASNNNNALFSAQPAIDAAGTLTYTPAANANGIALVTLTLHDNGGTANGGVDTSAKTLSITVNPVNDPPSFTKGADQTVNEDAGAQTFAGWASGINAGPPDEAWQALNFSVSNSNNALFSAQPAIDGAGTLTYTPAANANGSTIVNLILHDNGGTANGGVDANAPQTLSITINPVNDAPSFTKGADQTVNENAGTQTVAGWATGISAGPPDEAGQALNFSVSNNNNALFSAQPAIDAVGTLTYTPAANANGSALVTLILQDNGGTANGGVDSSAPQTLGITVNPVNHPPSFSKGADQTVNEDAGSQTVTGWATGISAGPPDESGQALNFSVSNNNNLLFSVQPAISAVGTLTYTPAPNTNGSATVTVSLQDNGGTANGGVDTSAPQTLSITVNPVNDPPSFSKGADQTVNEDAGSQTVTGWATGISAGPPDEAGQALNFSVSNNNNLLFSVQPAISAVGTLTYTPAPNTNGSATVTVSLQDNGGTANGGVDTSAAQTLIITVNPTNHPPILVAISSKSTAMSQPTLPIQLRLDDPDAGDLDLLTLTGKSSNAGLVSDVGGFAFEGSGRNWLLTVTPQPGQTGTAVLTVTVQDPAGATSSVGFQLDVYSGPQILTQPIGWTVEVGASVSLDVLAKSTPESELTYQWYKDTNLVAGAASSSLLFTNAQLADSGLYRVVITNNLGQVTSNPAQFTVRLPSRPVVGTPVTNWFEDNRTLTLKLRVDPSGEEPLSYQWFRNGVALADGPATATPPLLARGAVAGATTQELTITNFQTADAGLFTVRVGNAAAVVESSTLVIGISEVTPQAGDLPVSDNLPDAAYLQDARNWLTTDQSLGKANTRGFKNEPDEPQHAGRPGGSSGWFLWKAEARGVAAFTSAGSAFDTLLAVYRQADPAKPLAFANLGTVASDDDGGGFLTSYVRFNAEREVIYLIALDDRTGQGGDAVLSWQFIRDVTAPVIKTQPVSLAVHTNDPPGHLSVTLEDNQDDRFTFVWFRNGVPLQEGVEGFGGVHTRTLTLVGWNEEKVALYTVAITSNQSGLSVESNPAIVELISGDASANYTARSKLADAFVPTRPPAGPGLAASLQRSDRRGIGLLTTGASAGTIITTGKGEGSIPPEGCGLEADTVWRVATDLGFPPKAFVVMEAEANKLPFNLSLWTSDCTLADLNDLSCLHAQNWNCVTVRNGNVARLEFAASPDLQYIIAINGVGGADGRVKLSWQTEILRSSITFKDGGWVVIDTGENPGLKAVEHVSISNQPDSSNPNLKVESNAAATRFWFPVLTGTNYAIKLNPESYPYEKLVYTTKAGSPNIEVAAAGSSDRKIRLSWSGEGVSLRSTTDLTATWQSNPDLKPIISGESHELNLTPGQTPAIFFRLVPDP